MAPLFSSNLLFLKLFLIEIEIYYFASVFIVEFEHFSYLFHGFDFLFRLHVCSLFKYLYIQTKN